MKRILFTISVFCMAVTAWGDDVTFTCGNHSPHHSTSSLSEAKDFVKQYACSSWKVTSPGGTLSIAAMEKLRENLVASTSKDSSTTTTTTSSTDGTVTTYEPGKTIVVRRVDVTDPVSYVLGKTVRFVNKEGKDIQASMIKPGTRVQVYYDGTGDARVVNRVVVDD